MSGPGPCRSARVETRRSSESSKWRGRNAAGPTSRPASTRRSGVDNAISTRSGQRGLGGTATEIDREKIESASVRTEHAEPGLDHRLPGETGMLDGAPDQGQA